MYRHFLSVLLLITVTAACAAPAKMTRIDIAPTQPVATQRVESEKNYVVGQIHTAYVGQPVITRKSYRLTIQDSYAGIPTSDISITSPNASFMLKQGLAYPASYQVELDGKRYSGIEVLFEEKPYQVLMDDTGQVMKKLIEPDNDVETFVNINPINARVLISRPGDVLRRDFTEFVELLYGGLSNNQISLSYREFNENGSPRPEFFETLTYPTNSEFIRFKSTKIKVHKADSEVLIYEVVSE